MLYLEKNAWTQKRCHQASIWVQESSYVGDNPLTGTFERSKGFSIIFKHGAEEILAERFPILNRFFIDLQKKSKRATTLSWKLRRLALGHRPNAYYLNVLCLPPGGSVAPHVDATLQDIAGHNDIFPQIVSVLYVDVPEAHGGDLLLRHKDRYMRKIRPKRGHIVHFSGHLSHEITTLLPSSDCNKPRISFVCEQYWLPEENLRRVPEFKVQSRSRFGHILQKVAQEKEER